MIRWRSWHRWSALCLLAYIYLAVAAASHRDRRPGLETGLIPLTIPELVRLLREHRHPTALPRPGPPPALVTVAPPSPVPSQPSPPTLACLRRCHTMITTNVGLP